MEFETGATRDGHLVARKARLILDKGAYCGEGGFLGQMAAMHACGPYVIDAVFVESFLNYSNRQPSGSVRAPTAPQVCWGLEQHMDEVARRARHRSGRAPATDADRGGRRGSDAPDLRRDRRQADVGARRRDDRLRARPPRRRGDRRRGGLVAVRAGSFRRLHPPERRRQRNDRDRRPGERQRSRDGDAEVRRRGARHGPGEPHAALPGHRGGELGHGLVRLTDHVQLRSGDPGRGRRRARPAPRRRRRGARGRPRGPRARRGTGAGEGLARPVGLDRGHRRRRHDPREGVGRGPRGPRWRHGRLRGPSRERDVRRPAADHRRRRT